MMANIGELGRKILSIQKVDFYALDIDRWQQPRLPRMRLKVTFDLGSAEDILRLAADRRMDARGQEEYYRHKLRLGHRLLVGRLGDDAIFYLWAVVGKKSLMDKILLLEPGEIAVERAFTRRDMRGHGLYAHGLNFLLCEEKALGARRCLTEIACNNRPMISTARKYGFEPLDSCYYWISHPFRHHVFVFGSLRSRSRPNDLHPAAWKTRPWRRESVL